MGALWFGISERFPDAFGAAHPAPRIVMKVGLFITNQQYLDTDMVSALDDQYAMVRTVRDHGWDSLFSGQHYLNEGNNRQLQLVPLLARLQAEAGEMTLGLGILLINLHNPVYVAETVATLDVICRGNFVFGVGLGYRQVEFDAFRVPKGQRVKRFEECLELVRRLWTEDSVTHESEVCKLDGVRMNIRPIQQPCPPIWFAANNDTAVRRAARLGDTWFVNPHSTTETNKRQIAIYKEELQSLGKPFPAELPIAKEIFCAKDRATALEMAGRYLAGKYQDYTKWGQSEAMPQDESLDQPLEALLQDRFVLGSPEECFEQLRPNWEELGVNHLIFRTHWAGMPLSSALYSMRLISRELLPELRKV
jgi:alkanesulfonate monooxygenase SsuD/methylene tetrahydromethanopterin reductase-like flavin-dependent oxidoreductase (luciferase family)